MNKYYTLTHGTLLILHAVETYLCNVDKNYLLEASALKQLLGCYCYVKVLLQIKP